jgi:hypothetical protein
VLAKQVLERRPQLGHEGANSEFHVELLLNTWIGISLNPKVADLRGESSVYTASVGAIRCILRVLVWKRRHFVPKLRPMNDKRLSRRRFLLIGICFLRARLYWALRG